MQVAIGAEFRDFSKVSTLCQSPLHMAYCLGPENSLLRQAMPAGLRGGWLGLLDTDAPPLPDPAALAEALVRECRRQQYAGVVLDFREPVREDLQTLARCLGERLPRQRLTLCGPASLEGIPGLLPLICTAISGGNLRSWLQETAARTQGRFALDLQRLRMDFPLPAREGLGHPLSGREFQALWDRLQPASFYSPDLGTRYFSYEDRGAAHLVLYDDANTLRQKLNMAAALNCPLAFLMWPEIRDLLPPKSSPA